MTMLHLVIALASLATAATAAFLHCDRKKDRLDGRKNGRWIACITIHRLSRDEPPNLWALLECARDWKMKKSRVSRAYDAAYLESWRETFNEAMERCKPCE